MERIEITLDIENGAYHIDEIVNDSYKQGLVTYNLKECLLYINELLEDLNNGKD